MGKNRVKKEDFSKLSTGEIPVSTGPVDFLNRSGPAGPVPVPALVKGTHEEHQKVFPEIESVGYMSFWVRTRQALLMDTPETSAVPNSKDFGSVCANILQVQ